RCRHRGRRHRALHLAFHSSAVGCQSVVWYCMYRRCSSVRCQTTALEGKQHTRAHPTRAGKTPHTGKPHKTPRLIRERNCLHSPLKTSEFSRVCPSVPTRSLTGFSVRTVSEARGRYARAFLMNTYLVGWVDGITMSTPRLWFSACVAAMSTSE